MSFMVRFFVFTSACTCVLATWSNWPLVSIQWDNYRASAEKVCFYFWGHNSEAGPSLTRQAVGPVSYKESVTSITNFSSLWGVREELDNESEIPIYYGYAMTNASSCSEDPMLVTLPGINRTSRLIWLEHRPIWMAADQTPVLALYSNELLAPRDDEYAQGLTVQVEFGAPLHCMPEDDRIFPTLFPGPAFVYAANFPVFEDRSEWLAEPPIANELVVGFTCVVLDDPQGDGFSWVGNGTEQLNITLNLTEYVRSTCDFEGKAAKFTATVIGDGSAEFPHEHLVRMTPPSLFNCSWPADGIEAPTPAPTPAAFLTPDAACARYVGASALAAVVSWFTL